MCIENLARTRSSVLGRLLCTNNISAAPLVLAGVGGRLRGCISMKWAAVLGPLVTLRVVVRNLSGLLVYGVVTVVLKTRLLVIVVVVDVADTVGMILVLGRVLRSYVWYRVRVRGRAAMCPTLVSRAFGWIYRPNRMGSETLVVTTKGLLSVSLLSAVGIEFLMEPLTGIKVVVVLFRCMVLSVEAIELNVRAGGRGLLVVSRSNNVVREKAFLGLRHLTGAMLMSSPCREALVCGVPVLWCLMGL